MICHRCDGIALIEQSSLVGRELELETLGVFLDGIPSAAGKALLIEGEPGAGKTAVWEEGLSLGAARGFRTLVGRPAEVETAFSFAGLSDLLEPALQEVLPALAGPQRQAVEVALLLRPPAGPSDGRALGTAVINALRVLAATAPVLVAVDDVQWLDGPSHAALAFASRRLTGVRVGFMLTRRREGDVDALALETALKGRIEYLRPSPLSLGALNRLLQLHFGRTFSRPLVRRLRDASGGNPFFALELGRALQQSATMTEGARELPLPSTLREIVHDRLSLLPSSERKVLVAVAALSNPTFDRLAAAFGRPLSSGSLKSSLATRVVERDGDRIRFTHPLLGSVVYADAETAARRRLHRRLAEIVDDPDEAAQHLSLATVGPDPAVAERLEATAHVVHARGSPARAAELLTRAVELAPDDRRRVRRQLAAADCWTDAGDSRRAIPLLETALAEAASPSDRAEALMRLGWIRCRNTGFRDGFALFEQAARESVTDPGLRVAIEQGWAWAAEMMGDVPAAERHALAAVALADEVGEPAVVAGAVADLGFIELLAGRPLSSKTMRRMLGFGPSHPHRATIERARWLEVRPRWWQAVAFGWTDRLDDARTLLLELRLEAEALGHEHVLPDVLNWLGRIDCFACSWREGLAHAEEARDAAMQADMPVELPYVLATIALAHAHLGETEKANAALAEGIEIAQRLSVVPGLLELLVARGFLELSRGRSKEAYATLSALSEQAAAAGFGQPATLRFQPDLVEAALAVGDLETARVAQNQLAVSARVLSSPWPSALNARCEAVIAAAEGDLEVALAGFARALVEHERLPSPFERARTLLQQGIALRRLRRKRAAREAIGSALAVFEELAAPLWAERARLELARISGATAGASGALTETERRVAALVAAGSANKEVAAELHVTVRTVESNLTSIYRKLGIRSRGQLAATLNRPS